MTVRKVPKNQVPAALHDNQDAVTVSQEGDVVTVRQTGTLTGGYEGDGAIGEYDTSQRLVVLDLNVGVERASIMMGGGYGPSATPNEANMSVYGLGDGHMPLAIDVDMINELQPVVVPIVNDETSEETTITINFVSNE